MPHHSSPHSKLQTLTSLWNIEKCRHQHRTALKWENSTQLELDQVKPFYCRCLDELVSLQKQKLLVATLTSANQQPPLKFQ